MNLRRHLIGLLSIVSLWPSIGRAAESPESKLVLIGVQQQGRPQERLSRAVERRMDRMVEPYRLPRPALTSEEKACRSLECLLDIAQAQHADRLLGADLTFPMEQLAVATVWLFDSRSRQSAEEEARCEHCDAAALDEAVANAAARLLEKFSANSPINTSVTPNVPVVPFPGVQTSPATCPTTDCRGKDPQAQKRQSRVVAASVLGTLFAATLISSIALTIIDKSGDHLCRLNSSYDMRACPSMTGVYGTGYALSAVLGVGVALSLALPIK